MEDVTDADHAHSRKVCKEFEVKRFSRTLWFVWSKQYIIVSQCIWEL